jgi:hypothetical protein
VMKDLGIRPGDRVYIYRERDWVLVLSQAEFARWTRPPTRS